MSVWDAGRLLDYTQELLGEPIGGFYNLDMRLAQLNAFQRELVEETRALTAEQSYALNEGAADLTLPPDFLTFDPQAPYVTEAGEFLGNVRVKSMSYLDTSNPGWHSEDNIAVPEFVVLRGETLTLYPAPRAGLVLVLPYVPAPSNMASRSDLPFSGNERLNRFAPALSYQAAAAHFVTRNLAAAGMMQELYQRELRGMRSAVRSSPQYQPRVRVTPRR